jgi:aldose 1-epimerase
MQCRLLILSFVLSIAAHASVEKSVFGKMPNGDVVEAYTITNNHGVTAKVITLGATVADLRVPDKGGAFVSVVHETVPSEAGFQRGFADAAAVQGRVANRIRAGRFTLDGHEYRLATNAGPHHLHGGVKGFSRMMWKASPVSPGDSSVTLTYSSADGEEGYPGKLTVSVTYTLTDADALRIEYSATTDKPTPINLTNHAYFNLAGKGDVADSILSMNADRFTVFDADLIPTGEIKSVEGTVYDFRTPIRLGSRASQLGLRPHYDQNFVINRAAGDASLALAARVTDPKSGRTMECWTTEPGVQLYTSSLAGNPAPGSHSFFCLETEHYPDAINRPEFPSVVLRPGKAFHSVTEYRFGSR